MNAFLATVLSDLRYGFRKLVRQPGFSVVAILTLALGIGANSAIFSFFKKALLDPLPYRHADRLVMVWQDFQKRDGRQREWFSYPNLMDYKAQSSVLADLAGFDASLYTVTGDGGEAEAVLGQVVTPSMFNVLGARFERGRGFTQEEGDQHLPVAVVSHSFWQRRFGGDPHIVGRRIMVDDTPRTVVGVLPPQFYFPIATGADLFTPFRVPEPRPDERSNVNLRAIGRLKPGVTLAAAQADLSTVAARLAGTYPESNANVGAFVTPLRDEIMGPVKSALLLLLATVGLVLLIACVNVANLLLARAISRRGEVGVRTALGAERRRLSRQFVTESIVLALLGGAVGVVLAFIGVPLLKRLAVLASFPLPQVENVTVDATVLLFTIAVSLLTGLLFGLAPMAEIRRADIRRVLQEGAGASAGRGSSWKTGRLLVVLETALAFMLLVGAGLTLRSFERLRQVDTGYDPKGVLVFRLLAPSRHYPQPEQVSAFYRELIERLRGQPGVTAVAGVSTLPLAENNTDTGFTIEGRPETEGKVRIWYRAATPGYFQAMHLPVLRGRGLEERDQMGAPFIAVINESLAKQYFPDRDPLGKMLKSRKNNFTIVGVVKNATTFGLTKTESPAVYFSHAQFPLRPMGIVLRTTGDPNRLVRPVRTVLHQMDPRMPPLNMSPLADMVAASVAPEQALGVLMSGFGILALVLAAVGLYGLMAYVAGERIREFGIRMALGADALSVRGLVLRQALLFSLAGAVVGVVAALSLTRFLRGILFEIQPLDPLSFSLSLALLIAVTLIASYVPAWRASRIDPSAVLRS
jgi:putative ABC transport system permease protein